MVAWSTIASFIPNAISTAKALFSKNKGSVIPSQSSNGNYTLSGGVSTTALPTMNMNFGNAWQGLGALGSGIMNMISGGMSAKKAFKYNKQLIEMQQQWQERMSNTAHQREVADLRAAGLNPILSATGGSGASFGSASAPSMGVDYGNPGTDISQTALSMANLRKDVALADSQEDVNRSNSAVLNQQVKNMKQELLNNKALTGAQVYSLKKQADASMYSAITGRMDYGINQERWNLDKIGDSVGKGWIERHPHQAGITYGLSRWMQSLSPFASGVVGAGAGVYASRSHTAQSNKQLSETVRHNLETEKIQRVRSRRGIRR